MKGAAGLDPAADMLFHPFGLGSLLPNFGPVSARGLGLRSLDPPQDNAATRWKSWWRGGILMMPAYDYNLIHIFNKINYLVIVSQSMKRHILEIYVVRIQCI
ncbi:hypothetical protein DK867_23460 [Ochrobactrum sp. POC9]|nr:hypothetical protein DK867_23460 [Ochrobactrum sp. POC9]